MIDKTLNPGHSHQNHVLMDHSQWFLCLLPLRKAPQWHLQCQNVEWSLEDGGVHLRLNQAENMSDFVVIFHFETMFACGIPSHQVSTPKISAPQGLNLRLAGLGHVH